MFLTLILPAQTIPQLTPQSVPKWQAVVLNAAVFIMLASALVLPGGYSIGAFPLLLLGLIHLPTLIQRRLPFNKDIIAWSIAIALMGAIWSMHIVDQRGEMIHGSLGLERCVKYLLVVLMLPAFLTQRPGIPTVRLGIAVGAGAAGLVALWQIYVTGIPRADSYTNAIKFGGFSLLASICSGIWALQKGPFVVRLAGWVGAALGFVACLLSGSRGSWLMFPLLTVLAFVLGSPRGASINRKFFGIKRPYTQSFLVIILLGSFAASLPFVRDRVELAARELVQPQNTSNNTSIGLRKAFWKQAWTLGVEHPWFGVGQKGYEAAQREAVNAGRMPADAAQFDHSHNEWLDMFAKRGLLGVTALALFFLIPGLICFSCLRRRCPGVQPSSSSGDEIAAKNKPADCDVRRAAALCGLVTVLGFIGFGLTDLMFGNSISNMMYLLPLSLWISVAALGAGDAAAATPRALAA